MRLSYYRFPEGTDPVVLKEHGCTTEDLVIEGIKVSAAKKLIKEYGGSAWTEHIDRDGGCFEVTEIHLNGNNSRFKYNHHL